MPRNPGLEELLEQFLQDIPRVTQKPMFGGMAFLVNGNLLCGASSRGLMARVGRDNEPSVLKIPGVTPMLMGERRMHGWVRATPAVYTDDGLRERLLNAALDFTLSLPKK